jgi:hypothetical protein
MGALASTCFAWGKLRRQAVHNDHGSGIMDRSAPYLSASRRDRCELNRLLQEIGEDEELALWFQLCCIRGSSFGPGVSFCMCADEEEGGLHVDTANAGSLMTMLMKLAICQRAASVSQRLRVWAMRPLALNKT